VVIDAELGRENHNLILATMIEKDWNHLIPELTPELN
jgi:hypothetical protein